MAYYCLQNRAFSRALTPNDDDAGKLEGVILVNAQEHSPDFDQLSSEVHQTVLPRISRWQVFGI